MIFEAAILFPVGMTGIIRRGIEPSRVESRIYSITRLIPRFLSCFSAPFSTRKLFPTTNSTIFVQDVFLAIQSISLAISPVRPRLPSPNRRAPLTRLHRADTDSLCRRRSFGHNTTSIHGGIHLGRGIQPQEATLNGFPDAPFTNSIVRNRCLQ